MEKKEFKKSPPNASFKPMKKLIEDLNETLTKIIKKTDIRIQKYFGMISFQKTKSKLMHAENIKDSVREFKKSFSKRDWESCTQYLASLKAAKDLFFSGEEKNCANWGLGCRSSQTDLTDREDRYFVHLNILIKNLENIFKSIQPKFTSTNHYRFIGHPQKTKAKSGHGLSFNDRSISKRWF